MPDYILADVTLVIRDGKIITMIIPPEERGKLKGLAVQGAGEMPDIGETVSVKQT